MAQSNIPRRDTNEILQSQAVQVDPVNDPALLAQRSAMMGFDPVSMTTKRLQLNSDGSLFVSGNLVPASYDSIAAAYPNATTVVYSYSLSGSLVATVTVVYTDSTKANLSSVTRS